MCDRVAVALGTEHDEYANALASRNQGNCTIRFNSLFQVRLFELKLKFSLQVPPHDGFLVLKHPPMMASFAVQY